MNLTAAGITAAGILLIAVISYAAWTANVSASERERTLVENALNRSILKALNEQKSIAWWDEAFLKITGVEMDFDFIDNEFGVYLTETYGHDKIFILDGLNEPSYVYTNAGRREIAVYEQFRDAIAPLVQEIRNGPSETLAGRPDLFGETQKHYRTVGSELEKVARWTGHILSIDGRPAIVAAMTILPIVDMELITGVPHILVSIVFLDEDYLADMGSGILLPDLKFSPTSVVQAGVVSDPLDSDEGRRAGYLIWKTAQPGRVLTNIILPLVILGVVLVAMQARSMLRRLRRTSFSLAQQEKRSRHAARHDALSGLPNRAHFAENLARVLAGLGSGPPGQRAIVAYIDVDRFKDVNDTLGHSAGDALITQVAKRLQTHVRAGDFIARYGGDEFAILWLSDDPRAASVLAERIAHAFVQTIDIDGQNLAVTASIGIAVAPDNGTTSEDVMRHADIALYEAKNAGRNCAVIFSEDMAEEVQERRAIELDLQAALASDALDLAYQPIISCRTGDITGIEALVRWKHPVRGFISPAVFIPIAEQAGLMPQLGQRIMTRAMSDWHLWPHLDVSVNLSPLQFRQADLISDLERQVREHRIDPRRFILEITEGVLMDAGERTRQILDTIRGMGFRTALDDFGTGYSSLAYLCNFRFDKIKIDRSFVSGLSRSESFQTIVQAVIALGKGLGMAIVAEGVETEAESLTMTQFGCTEMQGYYFAKPMDRDALIALLAKYRGRPLEEVRRTAAAS